MMTDERPIPTPVPTARLLDLLDPFRLPPWDGCRPFTAADVLHYVIRGDLHPHRIVVSDHEIHDIHVARIAWLVVNWVNNGLDMPIVEIVGPDRLVVHDGYHRICAAAARGDATVLLDIGGLVDEAEALLGVPVPCCDLHNRNCEFPEELCCRWCTEAAHNTYPTRHNDGSRCVLEQENP